MTLRTHQSSGAKRNRRPAYKVRSRSVTITLTPKDYDFVEDEARRRGVSRGRLLGDLVEVVVSDRLFVAILGEDLTP